MSSDKAGVWPSCRGEGAELHQRLGQACRSSPTSQPKGPVKKVLHLEHSMQGHSTQEGRASHVSSTPLGEGETTGCILEGANRADPG